MTETDPTWTLEEPADAGGRGLEETLVRRDHTALRCGGATFTFSTRVVERSETGCMTLIRFALREEQGAAVDHAPKAKARRARGANGRLAADPIALDATVRPRIQARAVAQLGPLEMPALRQAARRLLRAAAEQLAARE